MAKQLDYIASALKGTNRIVGESENDWMTVRPGSSLKFENALGHYTVASSNEFFYIKNFSVNDLVNLRVEENGEANLTHSDVLTVTYKEYELESLISIINEGENYHEGDQVEIPGEFSIDIFDNTSDPCRMIVTKVNEKGGVEEIEILNKGKYLILPETEILVDSQTVGTNLKIEVRFQECPKRSTLERTVQSVQRLDDHSLVTLNYALPKGIAGGKLSIKKWELLLTASYAGETKFDKVCHITRDFTPNLKLPLMQDGGADKELAYNETVSFLDAKITFLENKIKLLEGKIQ